MNPIIHNGVLQDINDDAVPFHPLISNFNFEPLLQGSMAVTATAVKQVPASFFVVLKGRLAVTIEAA
ncbi:MAG: hypothetical protein GY820_34400 [Gammaproteobacteria bacterium]|nr:hypothetical protein [Gammaproteobacteria bacterium]